MQFSGGRSPETEDADCQDVRGLAEVGAVAKDLVQRALVERAPLAEGARLCGPGLGPVALSVQLPDQQEGGAEVEEAPEDQAHQLGLGRVHHQLPGS
jgi:hypothetical protein